MNDLLLALGIEHWKPLLRALLLPPMPLLLLALAGAWLAVRRPRLARWLVALPVLALWLLASPGAGHLLLHALNPPPPTLAPEQIRALAQAPQTAIVVLGAGRIAEAPEYGAPDLADLTHARLRYGLWLASQTGLPVAYSGGVGHGAVPGISEAEAVRQVVQRQGGAPLRWLESRSRDTRENAEHTVALLAPEGVRRIVLVTHGFHQPRSLAAFRRAAEAQGVALDLVPAPMGLLPPLGLSWGDWLPSARGLTLTGLALHEWLGRLAGA